jgi:transposase
MVPREKELKIKLSIILPEMNERQRRIIAASEAVELGYGGVSALAEMTGLSRNTIMRGVEDLKIIKKRRKKVGRSDRVRKGGGGRKKITEVCPDIQLVIESLIEPDVRGDPESPLRWTCKSVRNISDLLKAKGYEVSRQTIANILHDLEFSLQGNRKTKEGNNHPDRDQQFRFINKSVKKFLRNSSPVISVDTKKKELVGSYKNAGKEWSAKGSPVDVNGHDFPDPKVPKAIPYGVYDIANDKGWISIGITADTAEFAVNTIRKWWKTDGCKKYPRAKELMICADAGGSNGYRSTLWKRELQGFANEFKVNISVRHFPPGTSKWNKIEHRLFSFVSINWRGKPLINYQTIVQLIAATKTKSGLTVKAYIDKRKYKKGIKVPKHVLEKLNIEREDFHGEWNYTLKPQSRIVAQVIF